MVADPAPALWRRQIQRARDGASSHKINYCEHAYGKRHQNKAKAISALLFEYHQNFPSIASLNI